MNRNKFVLTNNLLGVDKTESKGANTFITEKRKIEEQC